MNRSRSDDHENSIRDTEGSLRSRPFSLLGDLVDDGSATTCEVSCVINFYGRIELLEGILYSLAEQDLPRSKFEVILVEDRGGTEEGQAVSRRFEHLLNIRYSVLSSNYGKMGYSRNAGLAQARGRYVLFLDDDTVILERSFLSLLVDEFHSSGARLSFLSDRQATASCGAAIASMSPIIDETGAWPIHGRSCVPSAVSCRTS